MQAKVKPVIAHQERGYAELIAAYTDEPPSSERYLTDLGRVERGSWLGTASGVRYVKWFAYDLRGGRVGIHFATRKAALNALWSAWVKRLSRKQRRDLGLRLADVR